MPLPGPRRLGRSEHRSDQPRPVPLLPLVPLSYMDKKYVRSMSSCHSIPYPHFLEEFAVAVSEQIGWGVSLNLKNGDTSKN